MGRPQQQGPTSALQRDPLPAHSPRGSSSRPHRETRKTAQQSSGRNPAAISPDQLPPGPHRSPEREPPSSGISASVRAETLPRRGGSSARAARRFLRPDQLL